MLAQFLTIDNLTKAWALISAIGVSASGIWHYIKSRTYSPKLSLSMQPEMLRLEDEVVLKCTITLKNTGKGRVLLDPERSYVDVKTIAAGQDKPLLDKEDLATSYTLKQVTQLEPDEEETSNVLIKVPHENFLAFYLEFGVTSTSMGRFVAGRDWTRDSVVNCTLKG
jgi:hypothetical protein